MVVPHGQAKVAWPLLPGERRTTMQREYRRSIWNRKQSVRGGRPNRSRRRSIVDEAISQAEQVQLPLSVEGLIEMARSSLSTFAMEVGLKVAESLLEDEVQQHCGPRHERQVQRMATRYGHQRGFVTIGGQKLAISKPRVRSTHRTGEVDLETYRLLQSPDAMPESTLAKLVNGVSCRRYEHVVDVARQGFGVKKSSVSRGFVQASSKLVQEFAERRLDERFVVIYIDAQPYAGEMMVAALGITASGEKKLLGLRQGATENAAVCTSLLEELRERGVKTDAPTLFVLDGSKALRTAVDRVWGKWAVVQRCQVHKMRNVKAHLPEKHHEDLVQRLRGAYGKTDHGEAHALLKATVRWLKGISPSAGASLEEGLDETITVVRLGIPPLLRKTLSTTNPIESAFSVSESVTRRVKRWRNGTMRERWCVAGLLDAESRFRRIKGYRQMKNLIDSIESDVEHGRLDSKIKKD
jgi:transposase-like protein